MASAWLRTCPFFDGETMSTYTFTIVREQRITLSVDADNIEEATQQAWDLDLNPETAHIDTIHADLFLEDIKPCE